MKNEQGEDVTTKENKKNSENCIPNEVKKKPCNRWYLQAILKEKGYPIAPKNCC